MKSPTLQSGHDDAKSNAVYVNEAKMMLEFVDSGVIRVFKGAILVEGCIK